MQINIIRNYFCFKLWTCLLGTRGINTRLKFSLSMSKKWSWLYISFPFHVLPFFVLSLLEDHDDLIVMDAHWGN